MKKRFLGIISILYASIIAYVTLTNNLKNFLAPNMQFYIKASIIPLFVMGLVLIFNRDNHYKFKWSDLILLLPLVMIIASGDGLISMSLASNRMTNLKTDSSVKSDSDADTVEEKDQTENVEETENISDSEEPYDFDNPYFLVEDANYTDIEDYLTFVENANKYIGKTIKLRGFTLLDEPYIPDGYFAIGKYAVSCCTADAGFAPFFAKYDLKKIKNNTWYEIEGLIEEIGKNDYGFITAIDVINIREITSKGEEQYVYPCYSYGDGSCSASQKYEFVYE